MNKQQPKQQSAGAENKQAEESARAVRPCPSMRLCACARVAYMRICVRVDLSHEIGRIPSLFDEECGEGSNGLNAKMVGWLRTASKLSVNQVI